MNERIKQLMDQAGIDVEAVENLGEMPTALKFAELIVRHCAYHADVFYVLGCPVDMDPTETKPSDYIKRQMGIVE